jgi:tetratricopeptide (TPR) repeat protein
MRAAAVRALITSTPDRQLALALPMVQDEVLGVRIAAAGIVSAFNHPITDQVQGAAVAHAHDVWRQYQHANQDRPESLIQLAALNIVLEQFPEAETNFRTALVLEPKYAPTYVNFADFLRRQNRLQEADELLKKGIATATSPADIHHALGLLLVSQRNLAEARTQLEAAATQVPESSRYSYVYAVALYDSGQIEKGLETLEESLARHPWDWDSLVALALYSLDQNQPERALAPAQSMKRIVPGDAGVQNILDRISAAMERE